MRLFATLLFVLPLFFLVNSARKGEYCGILHWCIDNSECNFNKCYSKEDWNLVKAAIQWSPRGNMCDLLHWCEQGYHCLNKNCVVKEKDNQAQVTRFKKGNNNLKQQPQTQFDPNEEFQQFQQFEQQQQTNYHQFPEEQNEQQQEAIEEIEQNEQQQEPIEEIEQNEQQFTQNDDSMDQGETQQYEQMPLTELSKPSPNNTEEIIHITQEPIIEEPTIIYGETDSEKMKNLIQEEQEQQESSQKPQQNTEQFLHKLVAKVNSKPINSTETSNFTFQQLSTDAHLKETQQGIIGDPLINAEIETIQPIQMIQKEAKPGRMKLNERIDK